MGLRIRPNIAKMRPYSPGKSASEVSRELGLSETFKLASNENPLGTSPAVSETIRRYAESVHLYPDAAAFELTEALSRKFGMASRQVFLGNGSDECIRLLTTILSGGPDDEIMAGDPSFISYHDAANLAGATMVKVPLDSAYRHDLTAMARAITDRTRLIFIANPNNPTGTIVHREEFDAFLADVPESVLVVLDEAYYEFARVDPRCPDGVEYVKSHTNVCALRTFSKTYGLAGLRCGYGFGPLELVDAVQRARPAFNVNSLAQVAAIAALGDEAHLARTVANNREGLTRLAEILRKTGIETPESFANFVYFELDRPTQPIYEALLREGIIIRTGAPFGRPNAIRVSVGTPSEIDAFESAWRTVMAKEPARR